MRTVLMKNNIHDLPNLANLIHLVSHGSKYGQ